MGEGDPIISLFTHSKRRCSKPPYLGIWGTWVVWAV